MFFRVIVETYKETLTEAIIRIFIRVVVGAGIVLALFLFCKIALFSYGIDTKKILLIVHRWIKMFWRKIDPSKREN